ncbi:MAG TPA: hypothetical protein VGO80_10970 [Solirubrobacteraceae bacterium]|jgi:hypothetical protein|nr:hypothetical protein [Solirubrobacteraceae bacterium]
METRDLSGTSLARDLVAIAGWLLERLAAWLRSGVDIAVLRLSRAELVDERAVHAVYMALTQHPATCEDIAQCAGCARAEAMIILTRLVEIEQADALHNPGEGGALYYRPTGTTERARFEQRVRRHAASGQLDPLLTDVDAFPNLFYGGPRRRARERRMSRLARRNRDRAIDDLAYGPTDTALTREDAR